jgi:hypothetical protein
MATFQDQTAIVNQVFRRFHIIDDIKHILLHNLGRINQIQSEKSVLEMDISENRIYYAIDERESKDMELVTKNIELDCLTNRCMDDVERLIIEVQMVLDLHKDLEQGPATEEIRALFESRFSPFIAGISNLECLFLKNQTDEFLYKFKLLGKTLQSVIDFDIEIS